MCSGVLKNRMFRPHIYDRRWECRPVCSSEGNLPLKRSRRCSVAVDPGYSPLQLHLFSGKFFFRKQTHYHKRRVAITFSMSPQETQVSHQAFPVKACPNRCSWLRLILGKITTQLKSDTKNFDTAMSNFD